MWIVCAMQVTVCLRNMKVQTINKLKYSCREKKINFQKKKIPGASFFIKKRFISITESKLNKLRKIQSKDKQYIRGVWAFSRYVERF